MIRGLMTDQEWAIFEPFLTRPSPYGGRPPKNHRRVLDGVFWINRTGAPWRDLPDVFGNWNSVWRRSRRWCLSGVWDIVLQALADSGGDARHAADDRAYHGPGASLCSRRKGGSRIPPSGARGAASPPRSISAATLMASPSARC